MRFALRLYLCLALDLLVLLVPAAGEEMLSIVASKVADVLDVDEEAEAGLGLAGVEVTGPEDLVGEEVF